MKRRNLAKGNLKEIPKQIRAQRYATPLNGSAVGRKGLRVYGGGWIRIENGGLQVTGTAIISGTLNVTGTTNLLGINNLSGTNKLTGPTTVAGNFEIIAGGLFKAGSVQIRPDGSADFGSLKISPDGTLRSGLFTLNPDGSAKFGTLDISSDGTLKSGLFELRPDGSADFGELNIDADGTLTTGQTVIETSGKASFGSFVIDPSSNKLIEAPGGWLFTNGPGSIGLADSGSSSVSLNSSAAILDYKAISTVVAGVSGISLNAATTSVSGNLNLTGWLSVASSIINFQNLSTTSNPPNLYRDPVSGRIYASTWTP